MVLQKTFHFVQKRTLLNMFLKENAIELNVTYYFKQYNHDGILQTILGIMVL